MSNRQLNGHPISNRRPYREYFSDERGTINIMAAGFFVAAVGLCGLAVDVGSLYTERRVLQGVADLAAMAGARSIDRAEDAVAATLRANGVEAEFSVTRGKYTPDPRIAHDKRFVAGQAPFNAILVNLRRPGQHFFSSSLFDAPLPISVNALGATGGHASIAVGSRLLAVRDGVANTLLRGLTGSSIELSLMDYEALAKLRMDLLPYMNALATQIDLTAGTYQDVLDASVTMADLTAALDVVASGSGDVRAQAAAALLRQQLASATSEFSLAKVINLGPLALLQIGDPAPGLDTAIYALDMINTAAVVANGSRQVALDLGVSIPGLTRLTATLAIGEPMQTTPPIAVGSEATTVRTAQLRLRLLVEIGGQGVLNGVAIRLPLYIEAARAKARLNALACGGGQSGTATVAATPAIATAWIGDVNLGALDEFATDMQVSHGALVSLPLIKVSALSQIHVGNQSETLLPFTSEDIGNGVIKRTDTRDFTGPLLTSLIGRTRLQISVVGLNLGLPDLVSAEVMRALNSVSAPLDGVLDELLNTLGIHLGEADVRVNSVKCGSSQLAG